MKKFSTPTIFFVILLSIFPILMQAQIVNIPDANFKARLLAANTTNYIAKDSLGNFMKIDANEDGEIQELEASKVFYLEIRYSDISSLEGIMSFTKLSKLICSNNWLVTLNVNGLTSLEYLDCCANQLTNLDVSGLVSLEELDCQENQLVTLNVSGLSSLKYLNCSDNKLTTLNASGLVSLERLECRFNSLITLNVSGLISLRELFCSGTQLTTLDVSGLTSLQDLRCSRNQLTTLDVSGLTSLQVLWCDENQLTMLEVSGLTSLVYLQCNFNQLTTLDLSGLSSLRILYCSANQLTTLDASGLTSLGSLQCNVNKLTSLDVSGLTSLKYLECYYNLLPSLDVSGLISLFELFCYNNQLTSLNVNGLTSLERLVCYENQLANLDVSGLVSLEALDCNDNQLVTLNVSGLSSLKYLNCNDNKLTTLNASGLVSLERLECHFNPLITLNLSGLISLQELFCSGNQLTTLDVSGLANLYYLDCNDNQLKSIYMKGVSNYLYDSSSFHFTDNPNLRYICAYESRIEIIRNLAEDYGYTNVIVNSFCSTTLEGTHYTLQGSNKYDVDNDGCDALDKTFPNLKIKIQNATDSGYAISDDRGNFAMVIDSGTYTITPILPNDYFISSPTSTTITFPEDTIPQQFCIGLNGIHRDVSVSLLPTRPARPGFSDATYKIILTNKGNQVEDGLINFNYDETIQDFKSASKTPDNIIDGQLTFTFKNLQLFETREITIKLRTNSPADNPPVNAGDVLILSVTAILDNEIHDDWFKDNFQEIDQTVVGSIDPNDKTCLEGDVISPALVGDYVNYLIRFENTGTANAENVVVTDFIDINTFDIASLEVVSISHTCKTLITGDNQVKFVFDKIRLPFFGPNRYGYVAFKIKLKDNLTIGDSLKNNADIYFDYNLPVKTNTATSNIANITGIIHVTNKNGHLSTYPNPSNGSFTMEYIASGNYPITITLFDVTGKSVYSNELQHQNKSALQIQANNLPSGMYHLQVNSPFGMANGKVVVE